MEATAQPENIRRLLDFDPEIGAGIPGTELERARAACRVALVRLDPGPWESPSQTATRDDVLGYLVVDGILCREIALRESYMVELLGPGDVVLPPPEPDWPRLGGNTKITTITAATVAILGCRFAQAAARWPSLLVNVHRRLEYQRERLAIRGVIGHVPQAEHRLLLQLWHLATWWGRVTPDGMTVPFHLTHDVLGRLIAARRPTATLAARELEAQGYIRRASDGTWLLTKSAETAVKALISGGPDRSIGETLMNRHTSIELAAEA